MVRHLRALHEIYSVLPIWSPDVTWDSLRLLHWSCWSPEDLPLVTVPFSNMEQSALWRQTSPSLVTFSNVWKLFCSLNVICCLGFIIVKYSCRDVCHLISLNQFVFTSHYSAVCYGLAGISGILRQWAWHSVKHSPEDTHLEQQGHHPGLSADWIILIDPFDGATVCLSLLLLH